MSHNDRTVKQKLHVLLLCCAVFINKVSSQALYTHCSCLTR